MSPDVTWTKEVTFENFDPNKQFASKPLWGLFDGRKFKTYTQRGHAVNGIHHHYRAKLYEQTATGWELRATKDESNRPEVCQNCGASTYEVRTYYSYAEQRRITPDPSEKFNNGKYVLKRRGRKLVEPVEMLFVCQPCIAVVGS